MTRKININKYHDIHNMFYAYFKKFIGKKNIPCLLGITFYESVVFFQPKLQRKKYHGYMVSFYCNGIILFHLIINI